MCTVSRIGLHAVASAAQRTRFNQIHIFALNFMLWNKLLLVTAYEGYFRASSTKKFLKLMEMIVSIKHRDFWESNLYIASQNCLKLFGLNAFPHSN